MLRTTARSVLAATCRRLPAFRGKQRLGKFLQDRLTDYANPAEYRAEVRMAGGSTVSVDLRSPTTWPVYWTGVYDRLLVRLLTAALRPGDVVLDIGANVGLYVAQLAPAVRAVGGRYVAVEPLPANLRHLRNVVEANRLGDVVTVAPVGLGEADATARMAMGAGEPDAGGNAYIAPTAAGPEVTIRTLDGMADEWRLDRCDLLKIDVEGFEMAAFRGGRATLARTRPVIVCEVNDYWMTANGWSVADLEAFAADLGYAVRYANERRVLPAGAALPPLCNAILVPNDKRDRVRL